MVREFCTIYDVVIVFHDDLVVVDITVYVDGFHGDLNETFFVGEVDEAGRNLVQAAYDCLMKGISIGKGNRLYSTTGEMLLCCDTPQ